MDMICVSMNAHHFGVLQNTIAMCCTTHTICIYIYILYVWCATVTCINNYYFILQCQNEFNNSITTAVNLTYKKQGTSTINCAVQLRSM